MVVPSIVPPMMSDREMNPYIHLGIRNDEAAHRNNNQRQEPV